MAKQTLEQWIREALLDTDKEGRCTAIALVHMMGAMEKEIHAKRLPDKVALDYAEELADLFRGKAESYAEGLAGAQSFQLLAFYANRKQSQAAKPFIVQGYTQIEGLSTEGPNATGLLQQLMRHLEVKGQTEVRKDSILLEYMSRTIDSQTTQMVALRRENIESFSMVKDLIVAMAGIKHDKRMEELAYERSSGERAMLYKMGPALLNAATGREVIPQATEDTGHIETLIDALIKKGPEAMQLVAALDLPPAALMAFSSRLERAMKARELNAHARSPNGVDIDGEDDVNGGPTKELQ
jgi:hypothetical protein